MYVTTWWARHFITNYTVFLELFFFQELFQFWNLTIFTHVRGPWKDGKVTQTLKFRIHEACNAAYPQSGNVCNVTRTLYNTTNISPGVPARAWNTWLAEPGVWRWGSEERNSGTCKGWCQWWCSTPVQVLPRHPGQLLWWMMMLHLLVVCCDRAPYCLCCSRYIFNPIRLLIKFTPVNNMMLNCPKDLQMATALTEVH